ncbi:MAG: GtrA family protein [gamma proteobacterium symbiont of Taylorina sp.]|nr:GtrA family protein [gamma proteobacterium symbiont of Taylorina sp.]
MLAIKYTLFSIIAIFVNLLFQYISFQIYHGFASLYIAILIGTISGLICKYTLDKKYIFFHISKNKKDNINDFLLYASTGALITSLFWVSEIIFDKIFEHEQAKYLGAVIGLSIGYTTKYFLDKKYIFKQVT